MNNKNYPRQQPSGGYQRHSGEQRYSSDQTYHSGEQRYYGDQQRYKKKYNNYRRERPREMISQEECSVQYDYARKVMDDPLMTRFENIVISREALDKKNERFDGIFDEYEKELKDKNMLKEEYTNQILSLKRGIYSYGFSEPTAIQSVMIPQIIRGKDCLAQSQSGTGKTGAFVISALARVDENNKTPQVIILSPTHELAQQTYLVASTIAKKTNIKCSFTAGGTDRIHNLQELGTKNREFENKKVQVAQMVIATPGRLIDIMKEEPELFSNVKLLIVDECDALLVGEFKKDMRFIIDVLDQQTKDMQICLFSATLDQNKVDIANKILQTPVMVLIMKEHTTLECITQRIVKLDNDDQKYDTLLELLKLMPVEQFLVYVNTISRAEEVAEKLTQENIDSVYLNGDQLKSKRAEILRDFKSGKVKCLITTDVLARGIDIPQLSFVLNYDMPPQHNIPCYIHRIGRSGRNGKKGLAINFISSQDEYNFINMIQLTFNCEIIELESDFSIYQ